MTIPRLPRLLFLTTSICVAVWHSASYQWARGQALSTSVSYYSDVLKINVKNSSGNVHNATVTVRTQNSGVLQPKLTDPDGNVTFDKLKPSDGMVYVDAIKLGEAGGAELQWQLPGADVQLIPRQGQDGRPFPNRAVEERSVRVYAPAYSSAGVYCGSCEPEPNDQTEACPVELTQPVYYYVPAYQMWYPIAN